MSAHAASPNESRKGPRLQALVTAALIGLSCGHALAQSSFRIDQIYSNLDGDVQYIQLRETSGRTGQHAFAGIAIRSSSRGRTKEVVLRTDLPSILTGLETVLVSTDPGVPICCSPVAAVDEFGFVRSDFPVLPPRFLPVDGGTVEVVGVDSLAYAALPLDGATALDRGGRVVVARVRPFKQDLVPLDNVFRVATPVRVWTTHVAVREYLQKSSGHYFVTAYAADIEAIEMGDHVGWSYLGEAFWAAPYAGSRTLADGSIDTETMSPVCRYYFPPSLGDTHFVSASPAECRHVGTRFPEAILETPSAFHVSLPNAATGACPRHTSPVHRLWNGRPDTNHRYTRSAEERDRMVALGWIYEGIAFCQ